MHRLYLLLLDFIIITAELSSLFLYLLHHPTWPAIQNSHKFWKCNANILPKPRIWNQKGTKSLTRLGSTISGASKLHLVYKGIFVHVTSWCKWHEVRYMLTRSDVWLVVVIFHPRNCYSSFNILKTGSRIYRLSFMRTRSSLFFARHFWTTSTIVLSLLSKDFKCNFVSTGATASFSIAFSKRLLRGSLLSLLIPVNRFQVDARILKANGR